MCKSDIKKYLKDYMGNGGTVIITSHEEGELSLCDRMYLLKEGRAAELENCLNGNELMKLLQN